MLKTTVPKPHGVYPLTLFDDISTELGLTMGWLVEGIVDLKLISAALDRLLVKWPTLGGRLEAVSDNPASWASRQHPLTCWHITYFPRDGQGYSCIGLSFSHGLLDDTGISYLIHALEAEMQGREWEAPPLLHEGLNANIL
jgi:hypothetical protein